MNRTLQYNMRTAVNHQCAELWQADVRADRKLYAIKTLRDHTGMGLKEAKDVVEEWAKNGDTSTVQTLELPDYRVIRDCHEQKETRTIKQHSDGTFTLSIARDIHCYNLRELLIQCYNVGKEDGIASTPGMPTAY